MNIDNLTGRGGSAWSGSSVVARWWPGRGLSLRTRILLAIVGTVVATNLLASWAVNGRLLEGARREADNQARARVAMARALYAEHAAALAADAERIALYPAVIAAVDGRNPQPLLRWGTDVAARQGVHVKVVDATGATIAHGHTEERLGPRWEGLDVGQPLEGMQLALAGQTTGGAEASDEIGLAVRGYAPVRRDGMTGPVVGAVMLADPLDTTLLTRLAGGLELRGELHVEPLVPDRVEGCEPPTGGASATCRVPVLSPAGRPIATLARTVPLTDVQRARAEVQRALGLTGLALLVVGVGAAWLLARSLAAPLVRLTASAGRIARGDYSAPSGVAAGADEIGALSRAFDVMRQRVADATGTLRDERDVRDAVLESTGDGILMVSQRGETAVANARWAALVGGEGLQAAASLRRADGGDPFAATAAAWLGEPNRVAAADFERVGPPYRRFRCYSAPVPHRGAAPGGRIFVLRDVTREHEAERLRNAFLATVSHDLRAPLAAIAGYTDSLLRDDSWDRQTHREFLEIIASSADTLTRLVDNLLDAATLEAGALRLEPEPVRVERIAERVVAQRRPLAATHDLRLDIAPGLPLAHADPLRVEQVISNLVDNAIKYSPGGGPVAVRVSGGERGAALVVAVSDHGVGLTAEQAARVFERFYRAADALHGAPRGIGLGLFLCKRLVEAQGGRIWVESVPGQGSTFRFTLPALGTAEREAPGHDAHVAASPPPRRGVAVLALAPAAPRAEGAIR
ncbi:MAG TPA: ATP-binding protein [Chloroflexota bacterium]|jgi:signal transduction histidine kinase